jgi:hypothetical protein
LLFLALYSIKGFAMENEVNEQSTESLGTKLGNLFFTTDDPALRMLITISIALTPFLFWFGSFMVDKQERVVESTDIGKAVEAISIANGDRTQVRSTSGSYQVQGAFQLNFGNDLVLEKRANSETYLCDKQTKLCKNLAN